MRPIFKVVSPDDSEREITQRDQFNTDEVTLSETLVRESLQNSIDARRSGEKVFVRFSMQEPDVSRAAFWKPLLTPLRPHLEACSITLSDIDLANPRLLVIEDFGTTGLTGATDSKDESSFQDFWRRVGRSHKSGEKAGSWGLGKIVFPSSSRIRTFFGLTVQHDDPAARPLLMGQSVLRYHETGGRRYDPLGLFSDEIRTGEGNTFRVPSRNPMFVQDFRRAAGFSRTTEPGLSIAIPFIRDDIETVDHLIPFVVRNYFFPIITGQLEVEIAGVTLSDATFDELAARHGGPLLADGTLVRFIREIHHAGNRLPSVELQPGWADRLGQALGPEQLKDLREAYTKNQLVHVRAQVSLSRKTGFAQNGSFDLFLRLAEEGVNGAPLFVRGSITVPGEAQYFGSRQAFGALVAREGIVSQMLRDAENPAHTRWNGQAEKLGENWKAGSKRLAEIRHSLRTLHQLLAQATDRIEPDALRDILSIQKDGPGSGDRRAKPVIPRPPIPPDLPERPTPYRIARLASGFVVRSAPGLQPDQLPVQLKITAGYELGRGDPFKRHSPFDFTFQDGSRLSVSLNDAVCTPISPNQLLIELNAPGAEVAVSGFDIRRDLRIRSERHQ